MARYRTKDEFDLVWNRIRRRITMEVDVEFRNAREEALNVLLDKAFKDYSDAISEGDVKEVESKYTALVAAVVADVVPKGLKVADGRAQVE